MKRKVVGIALFCLVLLAAILAGYWDMLNTEQIRLARDRTSDAIGEMAGLAAPVVEEPKAPTKAPAPGAAANPAVGPQGEPAAPPAEPVVSDRGSKPGETADAPAVPTADVAKVAAAEPPVPVPDTPAQTAPEAPAPQPSAADKPAFVPLPDTAVAAAPNTSSMPDAPDADRPEPVEPSLPPEDAAPQPATGGDKGAGALAAPSFDILRVEPDGSTVLAGKAPAGTTVRLTDGTSTLGTETASPGGDFVVVLEKPLPVGDHQIRIEATDAGGRSVASKETAIVSVPEPGRESELLALVETPEQPSRLISLPEASAPQSPAIAPESPALAEEARPQGEADIASAQPGAEPGAASVPPPADAPLPGRSEAAATPEPSAGAPGALAVEAVEIEDETIYVAGRAPAGPTIRVYVDNRFLAEHSGRDTDRFLVTTRSTVAPGDHVVRADQIGPDGAVLSRVEVPFFKPEGRTMAAVSPGGETPTSPDDAMAAPSDEAGASDRLAAADASGDAAEPARPAVAESEAAPPPAAPASGEVAPPASLQERLAAVEAPVAPQPGTAAPEAASPSTEVAGLPNPAPQDERPTSQPDGPPIAPAPPAASRPAPSEAPVSEEPPDASAEASADRAPVSQAVPVAPATVPLAGAAPQPDAPASVPEPGRFGDEDEVATTRQAPLEAANARVIIRRGDTLWRISRDTYGLGARYTVIYLANGDQIRNPNRIYPGQVFRMPRDGAGSAAATMVE